jgi:hypothetical protein
MKTFRKDPERNAIHIERVRDWQQRNPEKVKGYVKQYRTKTSYYTPIELRILRKASKRLEKAVAKANKRAGIHGTSEFSGNDDFERLN